MRVGKSIIFLLSFFFVLLFVQKSVYSHSGINILEDCDLYLEYQQTPSLNCAVYASVLNSRSLAQKIDKNSDENISKEEAFEWVDKFYLPNVSLKVNENIIPLKTGNILIPSYKELVQFPDQVSISFEFNLDQRLDNRIYINTNHIEFANKANIEKDAIKSFSLNPASGFYIDIEKYDSENPSNLVIIPIDKNLKVSIENPDLTNTPLPTANIQKQAPYTNDSQSDTKELNIFQKIGATINRWVVSEAGRPSEFSKRFNSFLSNHSFSGIFVIMVIALLAGAAHALTPGHGKAFISAILIHEEDKGWFKAIILGSSLALAHTVSVIVIGLIYALFAGSIHDTLKQVLIGISYALIIHIGIRLFINRYKELKQSVVRRQYIEDKKLNIKNASDIKRIFRNGISGGIAPCAEALAVMFAAMNEKAYLWGVIIVISFSIGIALALIIFGLLVVKTKNLSKKNSKANSAIFYYLPIISSVFIILLGIYLLSVFIISLNK